MTAVLEKCDSEPALAACSRSLTHFLRHCGVETHGIAPIPEAERVDMRSYQLFLLWFSANMNIPTLAVGAGGPGVFKLSLLNTAINLLITDVLLFACLITGNGSILIPPHSAPFGPKLGTRAMVQARFSWGVYGIAIPSFLNVLSMVLYLFFGFIIGGQLLATVSSHLTPTMGIVIIALVSLLVSFCGYKTLHCFEAVAWIPTVIGICVMLGIGGHHLASEPLSYPAPTAASILSFTATVAAADLSWCTVTADYGVYHDANASSARIFTYAYLGIFLPSVIMHLIGAAFAAAAPGVPSWAAGYNNGNDLGGLVSAVLEPSGRFGKCLVVLMALAVSASSAPTMYSFGFSLMNISGGFAKVPRYVYAIIATGICIPLALVGQTRIYGFFVAFLGKNYNRRLDSILLTFIQDIIGYWSAAFAGIIFCEHVIFRRCDFARYKLEHWEDPHKLPPGLAAVVSFFGSFAFIIPCMDQTWYLGSIAKVGTGDIGLVVGFFSAGILYYGLRSLETRLFPNHNS
ncbi:permease for cytosine/purines, uracil, thiamine, allantoin-domain-containing protein [Mycena capillaripes]|nr:permease for cytosine/purines, uracil, thiamine, allantoin-domain-containing protein [Mycena capillaripes]